MESVCRSASISLLALAAALVVPIGGCASSGGSLAPDEWSTESGSSSSSAPPSAYAANQSLPYTQWPLQLDTSQGIIEVYQPQPEQFDGDQLKGRAAVSLTRPKTETPVFGALWFTARVQTDRQIRSATITDFTIRHVVFLDTPAAVEQQIGDLIRQQVPGREVTFSLDQLMTTLDLVQQRRAQELQLKNDPPKIIFSQTPATLVTLAGAPVLRPLAGSDILRVVNTPFVLLQDPGAKRYYLKAGPQWMSATEATGPWQPDSAVPAAIASAGETLVTAPAGTAAPTTSALPSAPPGATPQIIVVEQPTELIVTNGPPAFAPLVGNELLYASNTQSNLFKDARTGDLYVLLSGRWFKAPSEAGPWSYSASDKLPASFARIPPDSAKGAVLTFVADTTQAGEAKLDARIPQTAAVRRDAGASLHVTYDGEPRFEPIVGVQGLPTSYAANCGFDVFRVGNGFYCCYQGVWYDSSSPDGPWAVCVDVPNEIYQVPPSCRLFHDTYCRVYDYFPDTAYVGYTPGYLGNYVDGPTIVYGTGYNYPGWVGDYYVASPCTWGFGVDYDPWTCDWGYGAGYGWGLGWFGYEPFYHHWWGPGGYVDWHHIHDWHEGHQWHAGELHGPHEAGIRPYGEHAGSFHNIYTRRENAYRNAEARSPALIRREGSAGARPAAARISPQHENNVYAGENGRVFRYNNAGWEERSGSAWSHMNAAPTYRAPVYRAPAYRGGLEAERGMRERGAERSQSFGGHYGGGGFRGGGGGFHGGGGGSHGGGGGRR